MESRSPDARRSAPAAIFVTPNASRSASAASKVIHLNMVSISLSAPSGWSSRCNGAAQMIFVNSMSDLFHKEVPRFRHRREYSTPWNRRPGTGFRCSRNAVHSCATTSTRATAFVRRLLTSGLAPRSRMAANLRASATCRPHGHPCAFSLSAHRTCRQDRPHRHPLGHRRRRKRARRPTDEA